MQYAVGLMRDCDRTSNDKLAMTRRDAETGVRGEYRVITSFVAHMGGMQTVWRTISSRSMWTFLREMMLFSI